MARWPPVVRHRSITAWVTPIARRRAEDDRAEQFDLRAERAEQSSFERGQLAL
jgi:hypothetical protein